MYREEIKDLDIKLVLMNQTVAILLSKLKLSFKFSLLCDEPCWKRPSFGVASFPIIANWKFSFPILCDFGGLLITRAKKWALDLSLEQICLPSKKHQTKH